MTSHYPKLTRRTVLSKALSASALHVLCNAGLMPTVLAKTTATLGLPVAFKATTLKQALNDLNIVSPSTSRNIILTAPDIAENGSSVAIGVVSELPNTSEIYVFIAKNPNPLAASFAFVAGMVPEIRLYVRLNESGPIHIVVKSNGQFYMVTRPIQVTVGGCAG